MRRGMWCFGRGALAVQERIKMFSQEKPASRRRKTPPSNLPRIAFAIQGRHMMTARAVMILWQMK